MSDMPFGNRRIEIGKMLRNAMFAYGILTNSEVWHSITEKHIEDLQVMDIMLLKYITGAHAKVQSEFLYLETGVIPLKQIISSRRLMYLKNILNKTSGELVKRVYEEQKVKQVKGDWTELVKRDIKEFELNMDENAIANISKSEYTHIVKTKIKENVFARRRFKQEEHYKIRKIVYSDLKTQGYLKSHMMNNHEVSLLFSIRSRTTKQFKANFPYNVNQLCPMGCSDEDTPEHCLVCNQLRNEETQSLDVTYEELFSKDIARQALLSS